jgi:D-glycero-D-manno-heptose 1,7-bisphosphate phosphatase
LDWSQFVFLPGIRAALKQLASLGVPIIVISNQAAVGKDLLDPARLKEITAKMHQALLEDGTSLTAVYYCIHKADENCLCRKPKPALLQAAAGDFNIDLSRSVFIGDSDTDVQAARAVCCAPVLFDSSIGPPPASPADFLIARRVADLYPLVAKHLQSPARA